MNIHSYHTNIELPDSGGLTNVENYSGSTSSAYDEVSPHTHNSTPGSNDSNYEKNNQSTKSSKKSKNSHISSDDNPNLTVDALEKTLTEDKTSKIKEIIGLITNLSDTEKMLLQLQFPLSETENISYESSNLDLNSNFDIVGNCSQNEHSEALTWVTSHLEENKSTCLQKQEVYEDYKTYCVSHNIKCLSTADFGKVMKKVFPNIKARRLGARGQSRYCYSGLKNRHEIQSPMLIDVALNLDPRPDGRKRDNTSEEVDSYSSVASAPTDLSQVPEYELGPNIIIDSALVLLEFVRKVTLVKNIVSLKQAVLQLLVSEQVETRSPHALRLLSVFKQVDSHKSYPTKRPLMEQHSYNPIKKEETLSSPCSVSVAQHSSIASPHSKKSRTMFPSPAVTMKSSNYDFPSIPPHNSPINTSISTQNCTNQRQGFNYNPHYYNSSGGGGGGQQAHMLPMSHSLSSTVQKFVPANFSTPVKTPAMIEMPQLNSPLLERNPTTTKKLELANQKFLYHPNNPVGYSGMHERQIPIDRRSKQYYDQLDRCGGSYSGSFFESTSVPRRPMMSEYHQRLVGSPITMTERYVSHSNEEIQGLDDIDTSSLHVRQIGDSYADINYCPSPRVSNYNDALSSNYGSNQSPGTCAPNTLNTPVASPTHSEDEPARQMNVTKTDSYSLNKSCGFKSSIMSNNNVWPPSLISDMPIAPDLYSGIHVNPSLYQQQHHMPNTHGHFGIGTHQPLHSDESSVTSTTSTSTGLIDHDGHPSTTMFANRA